MKKIGDTLTTLIAEEAERLETFIVGRTFDESGCYSFFIDSAGQLNMKTITEITRNVSARIDEANFDDTPFTFEVSSPGAEKPLTDIRQFAKHCGRTFEIQLKDSLVFEGKLKTLNDDILEFEKKEPKKTNQKKTESTEIVSVPFDQIQSAIIKLVFK